MKDYINLITNLPEKEQAFITKRATWDKYSKIKNELDELFKNKLEMQISREDLLNCARNYKNTRGKNIYIISTILWGYSNGMRGNNFNNLINNLDRIIICLDEAKNGISNWVEHYKKVDEIKGLGLSTYSKLLYFLDTKIESYKSVILDNRIIQVINNDNFTEFNKIKSISYNNAKNKFVDYLQIINEIASQYSIEHGKIEMFLFEYGLNLKKSINHPNKSYIEQKLMIIRNKYKAITGINYKVEIMKKNKNHKPTKLESNEQGVYIFF